MMTVQRGGKYSRDDVPTYDLTGREPRLVKPAAAGPLSTEPSPLLEAIRAYLDSAR